MSEENKNLVLRSLGVMAGSGFDIGVASELHTHDYLDHEAKPGTPRGPEGVVTHATYLRGVFPDLRFEIQDVIAEADKVVVRCLFKGTHLGDFFGIAPTGRTIAVKQIHIVRVEGGRIAEHWALRDESGMMAQLRAGAVPRPEPVA